GHVVSVLQAPCEPSRRTSLKSPRDIEHGDVPFPVPQKIVKTGRIKKEVSRDGPQVINAGGDTVESGYIPIELSHKPTRLIIRTIPGGIDIPAKITGDISAVVDADGPCSGSTGDIDNGVGLRPGGCAESQHDSWKTK